MNKRLFRSLALMLALLLVGTACNNPSSAVSVSTLNPSSSVSETKTPQPITLLVAAAASLEKSFSAALIPMFQDLYPHITVEGTYDSSGKLQTQIEEGLAADIFMSAAMTQMNNLKEKNLVDHDSIIELLENRIVLIASSDSELDIASFDAILKAETIAIGDPESVPAGQYAKEALSNLELYDAVSEKASLGTNVTEVLNWVAEGSADVGIVYATDAFTTDKVKILAEAPQGSLAKKVIYPVGIIAASEQKEAAQQFLDFLNSEEALAVFANYGFSPNE